jgi:WD repeat-containing protein 45
MSEKIKALNFSFVDQGRHVMVCTNRGFRLHERSTCKLKVNTESIEGGLSQCMPYLSTNIFFMVGTGENADLPTNKLCLWDDAAQKIVADVQFYEAILDLQVQGGWVAVTSAAETSVFNLDLDSGMEKALAVIPTKITRRG